MMVRIMSVLPLLTGSICVLLVLVGAIGYTSDSETVEVPIPPCIPGSDEDCEIGMNQDNLSVPQPFMLLDVTVDMRWDHGDDAWIGVVDVDSIDWEKYNACFPGKYIPSTRERNDPNNIPCTTLFLNVVDFAYVSSI